MVRRFITVGGNLVFTTDPWIYRIVVGVLGLLVLSVVLGAVILGKEIPQGILALGSAAVGGLVGLLVPSPIGKSVPPAKQQGS